MTEILQVIKNTLIIDRIYQNNKRTFVGFHPNYTTNFNAKYSSFTSLTARPDNFDSSNFPLVGRENRCVWVSKCVYSVNSKQQQQQTYAPNTYRLWTHRDLIEALGPSLKTLCGTEQKVARHCAVPDGHMINKMAPAIVEPAKLRNFLPNQCNAETRHDVRRH